jgi:SAM-dependent methyltransferase
MYLLIPGRHHLLTQFQYNYISTLLSSSLNDFKDVNGKPLSIDEKISAVIFAVTSANHSNTRRNPLPFYIRAIALEEFGKSLTVPCFIYGVDDVGNVKNFSSYTIKRIIHDSEGMFDLRSENTLVLCSTPVLEMYEKEGFRIIPAELEDRKTWKHNAPLPWDIVEKIASMESWEADEKIRESVHSSSYTIWKRYRLGAKVQMLFRDKMISDDGDITTTRDYNTYVRQMDEIALLKYQDTAPHIQTGRVGDIGCAVGSWIKLACEDERLRESDFYGIEVARHLYDICQQRKHNGEFKNPFVFFSQRNAVTGLVFEKHSMNTIHTSSLTHEIESYGSREDLLSFIKNRYEELAPGGVWVNRDVVGPKDKNETILMKLNKSDGRNEDFDKSFDSREALAQYLKGLSTYGRFLRFALDFRKKEGYKLKYEIENTAGVEYVHITLKDACEFMSRKDYVDNWESEMHETFCFWDFEEWKQNLERVGFSVSEKSKAYTNEWIVKNRLEGRVELYKGSTSTLEKIDFPVTNMIMLAIKN